MEILKKKKNEKDEITKKRLLQRAQRWQVPIDSRTKTCHSSKESILYTENSSV